MKKILNPFLLFVVAVTLGAETYTTYNNVQMEGTEESESRLGKMISDLDMNYFADSIDIDFADWKTCGDNVLAIPGVAACYDEPLFMADYSKEPLKIQSLGISLSTDPQKAGYTRKSENSLNSFGHVNLIKFSFLGMIIDSKFMCLSGEDISLAYLSAFDPMYDGMFTNMMYTDINIFFKPQLMLLGVVDCAASSVSNFTSGLSETGMMNDRLRMAFPQYFGCWNAFPMGGYSANPDPILSGGVASGFALSSIMRTGLVKKSIRIKGLDGKILPDTMCGAKLSPTYFIKPQFNFQLIYPTTSRVVPMGAVASEWAEFKNTPESIDNSAFWIWKRNCLYLGAAECSK